MSDCEFGSRLSAYHDNELSPADRAAVEAHLQQCADCRLALGAIRDVSGLFAAAPEPAPLSQIARHRLHRGVDRQMERGLVRLSAALSGIAAAVMIAGSVWLKSAPEPTGRPNNMTISYTETSPEQYYLADATIRIEEW